MKRSSSKSAGVNMTAMIDVVFQMIIFFVCTVQLEQEAISEWIRLPDSPNGSLMDEEKDPRTVTIEVDAKGRLSIARMKLSEPRLRKVLEKAVADCGPAGASIPVRIRADAAARHCDVRRALDACSAAGLSRISFIATKDSVGG